MAGIVIGGPRGQTERPSGLSTFSCEYAPRVPPKIRLSAGYEPPLDPHRSELCEHPTHSCGWLSSELSERLALVMPELVRRFKAKRFSDLKHHTLHACPVIQACAISTTPHSRHGRPYAR